MMTTRSIAPDDDKQPLRFCMVTTFYPPYNFGGDGIFVQRLARALAQRGHRVTVIHCIDAYRISGGDNSDKIATVDPEITVHALSSNWGPVSPLITHQFSTPGVKARALHQLIEDDEFDVIHFHNISLIGGLGILDYGSAIKLYTAHEYWLLCPLSSLWKFDTAPCRKTQCTQCTLKAGRPPQLWRSTSRIKRKFAAIDAVLAPSQFVIDRHLERGMDLSFRLLPNFLPKVTEQPLSIDERGDDTSPFFLVVGRLEKPKGFQNVIDVFAKDRSARLLIAGTGPYEKELKNLAGNADNIDFTGYLEYEKLTSLYRKATAVIVPSLWEEPFGLIVLEAFAQSTPVIVNNSGALPELAESSGGGLVYNNQDELGAHVDSLLSESEKRMELGRKGHSAFLSKWTETTHLENYFRIIEEATRNKQRV